jgi:hypothetical protein
LVCEDESIVKAIPEVQGIIHGTLQGSQEFQGGIILIFRAFRAPKSIR